MSKIHFVIDAACDLTRDVTEEYGITMLGAKIHAGGRDYTEKLDVTNEEFYKILAEVKEIPTTSHVSPHEFQQDYTKAYENGFTDIIHVTIHSGGSNTLGAATIARTMFFEEHPEAAEKIRIHLVDSNTYSVGYGYPTKRSAQMAREGKSVEEILAFLEDWFDSVEIQFAVYTLEYVRKSGRVSAAAAFAGDLIGLKPIICLTEGNSVISEKIRGERKVLPRLAEIVKSAIAPVGEYFIIKGTLEEPIEQLAAMLTEAIGYPPTEIVSSGPSIVINAGPKIAGVVYKGKKRGHRAAQA